MHYQSTGYDLVDQRHLQFIVIARRVVSRDIFRRRFLFLLLLFLISRVFCQAIVERDHLSVDIETSSAESLDYPFIVQYPIGVNISIYKFDDNILLHCISITPFLIDKSLKSFANYIINETVLLRLGTV